MKAVQIQLKSKIQHFQTISENGVDDHGKCDCVALLCLLSLERHIIIGVSLSEEDCKVFNVARDAASLTGLVSQHFVE